MASYSFSGSFVDVRGADLLAKSEKEKEVGWKELRSRVD